MLPIFFLAFAFIYQLSGVSCGDNRLKLNYYDAERDLNIIRQWYNEVSIPLDEATSMPQLLNEARHLARTSDSVMYEYLKSAIELNKCVPCLTLAECLVVTMYTDDSSDKAFYREYNAASTKRIWQPYRAYTTLLMSALGKLSRIHPPPRGATLYRGFSSLLLPPTSGRLFFKSFTSFTLNYAVAKQFAGPNGIILKVPILDFSGAAKVGILSKFGEEEVLFNPFVEFDFRNAVGKEFFFDISVTQQLLSAKHFSDIIDLKKCSKP